MKRTNVIAYVRWSSKDQTKGDSKNRQIEAIHNWGKKNGYTFDTNNILIDEGLSAYKGHHKSKGKLGRLWSSLRSGEINPAETILVTESLDRLSREQPHIAVFELTDLIQRLNLELVTLIDGMVYRKTEILKNERFLMMVLKTGTANNESIVKEDRVGKAWANKRRGLGTNLHYTKKRPFWIGYDEEKKTFTKIDERVKLVRDIFNKYINGHGTAWITSWLNKNKFTPWGKQMIRPREESDIDINTLFIWGPADRWLNTYVKKILTSIATYGAIQPHTKCNLDKRIPVGEPIENYYPPAIEKKTFELAQLIRSKRFRKTGRPSRGNGNLFPTLCRCGFCKSSMHYVSKNFTKGEIYLVCSKARYGGGCTYISYPYGGFEKNFLRHVRKIPFTQFGRGKEKLAELRSIQLDKEASLAGVERRIDNLVKIVEEGQTNHVKSVANRLTGLEEEKTRLLADLAQLTKEMVDLKGFDENSRTVTSLLEDDGMKEYLTNPDLRHHLKEAIGKMVKRIEVFPAYNLDPRLRKTRHFVVHFVDGTTQKCLGQGESEMIYAKTETHEASWSPSFAQHHLALLPSLSGLDSGKTEHVFKQPKPTS